jgi:hypothetical protein
MSGEVPLSLVCIVLAFAPVWGSLWLCLAGIEHRSTTSDIEVISEWLNMPRRDNFDNRSFTQSYNFDYRSYFDFGSGKDLLFDSSSSSFVIASSHDASFDDEEIFWWRPAPPKSPPSEINFSLTTLPREQCYVWPHNWPATSTFCPSNRWVGKLLASTSLEYLFCFLYLKNTFWVGCVCSFSNDCLWGGGEGVLCLGVVGLPCRHTSRWPSCSSFACSRRTRCAATPMLKILWSVRVDLLCGPFDCQRSSREGVQKTGTVLHSWEFLIWISLMFKRALVSCCGL